jgi:outer membrane lipoprotein LolB
VTPHAHPRALRWLLALFAALLLSACAAPPRTPAAPGVQAWSGRLALTVEGQASQSFSAGFELKGAPDNGELTLYNPLGGTVAVLAWSPGTATLRAGGSTRQFPSLEVLAQEATGAPLPVAALFDWLVGRATPVEGWEPDVAQVAEGRLRARRHAPPPVAELRVVFER